MFCRLSVQACAQWTSCQLLRPDPDFFHQTLHFKKILLKPRDQRGMCFSKIFKPAPSAAERGGIDQTERSRSPQAQAFASSREAESAGEVGSTRCSPGHLDGTLPLWPRGEEQNPVSLTAIVLGHLGAGGSLCILLTFFFFFL